MKKKINVVLLIISLISCSTQKESENIVLKIGQVEISKFIFDRSLAASLTNRQEISNKQLLAWKQHFIEKNYLIADAYAKKYDTISTINTKLKHVSNFMMSQKQGYLWQYYAIPIIVQNAELTPDHISKRSKIYYFQIISTNNISNFPESVEANTKSISPSQFNTLKDQPSVNNNQLTLQWPFLDFWEYREILSSLNIGEVSPILEVGNEFIYLKLDRVEVIDITEEEKLAFQYELYAGYEIDFNKAIGKEIDSVARPILHESNIELLMNFMNEGNMLTEFPNSPELIRYYLNDTLQIIDYSTFLEFHTAQPMQSVITDKSHLIQYIEHYCQADYLSNKARDMGLFEVDTFKIAQQNFKNNLILDEYINKEIRDSVLVDSSEIMIYYQNNKNEFTSPKELSINAYFFNNEYDAHKASMIMLDYLEKNQRDSISNASVLKRLKAIMENYLINTETYLDSKLSEELMLPILQCPVGRLSPMPVEFNNRYTLIYKVSEDGVRIKKYNEVRNEIERKLRAKKVGIRTLARLKTLQSKYTIEIDNTELY